MQSKENKNVGPIVGTFVVVVVLIAIALYMFASHINRQAALQSVDTIATSTATIQEQNRPDDIKTLKEDLNNAIR
jgi:hypothetical protein